MLRLLGFTLFYNFIISKGPFATQIDIWDNWISTKTWIWYISKSTLLHLSARYKLVHLQQAHSKELWGEGRFLKIRKQILNRSERLNYRQTLQLASYKYLYQIQVVLVYAKSWAYNFMIKRNPRGFNTFTKENKRRSVSLSMPYIWLSLSRSHQTVTIMNLNIYCFWMPWKETETSFDPALMGNCPTCSYMSRALQTQ